jgi:transposase
MAEKKYMVKLSRKDRSGLQRMINKGRSPARRLTHARILLKADTSRGGQGLGDEQIAQQVEVGRATVERVRRRFALEGLQAALEPKEQQNRKRRKIDGEVEAKLVTLACGPAPAGHATWSMELLADQLVRLKLLDSVCAETVRQALKKTSLSRG